MSAPTGDTTSRGRYAQCDETCTVDCGHCKGAGRPAPVAADAGSGVDPAEIARQRALGWPDMHPEDYCHTCGRPNPTWFADTVEWQAATGSTGDGGGILCPSCFCALYRKVTGKTAIIWRLSIDPRSRDAAPAAAEGSREVMDLTRRTEQLWSDLVNEDDEGAVGILRPYVAAMDEAADRMDSRVAAEGTDDLRETLAAGLRRTPEFYAGSAEKLADALLAGPVADLIRDRDELLAKVQAVEDGALLIAAERRRQIDAEGWTPEHDAEHAGESLALAACCYAVPPQMRKYRPVSVAIEGGVAVQTVPTLWPWAPGYWKPNAEDRIRELVKAGALVAAEIDRLRALDGESRG